MFPSHLDPNIYPRYHNNPDFWGGGGVGCLWAEGVPQIAGALFEFYNTVMGSTMEGIEISRGAW